MTEPSRARRKRAHPYIKPSQRIGEREKLDPHWRKLFLDTLAETSNVSEAARVAQVNPSRAYKVRRWESEFRRQWVAALLEGYEHLEMETLQRLRAGTGKDDPKFDIANALRLLALHRQTVVGERARREEEDVDTILSELDAKIDAMRAREREAARIAHEAANPDRHDLG